MDPDEAYADFSADVNTELDYLRELLTLAQAATLDGDAATANRVLRDRRMNWEHWPGVDGSQLRFEIDQHLRGLP